MIKEPSKISEDHFGRSKSFLKRQDTSIITRAYTTLNSHKRPLSLPGISRSSRHISFYDYLPHRKVWSEKDQRKRDRSRNLFREEVKRELERQQANEEAKDRELFPPKDEDVDIGEGQEDEEESYLEQYFPSIRNRKSSVKGTRGRMGMQNVHTFFPEIENYDFAPRRAYTEGDLKAKKIADDSVLSESKLGIKADNESELSDIVQPSKNERRVSFNLMANKRKTSLSQQTVSSCPDVQIRKPSFVGHNLREISEAIIINKNKNAYSNLSKHSSRLHLLHDSIEESMEVSRHESRNVQRRTQTKSAGTSVVKPDDSANEHETVYPLVFAHQPIKHLGSIRDNVVITEPLIIKRMGMER
ncbi:uncharacterized protein [Antedon mediterranea]|uniref:uncharacterized protein n=1 Tax=Antedon mediterranea TaxID=105859 RepID=UPI003AF9B326